MLLIILRLIRRLGFFTVGTRFFAIARAITVASWRRCWGRFVFDAQTHGRNRVFFPSATHFWTPKICSIFAGKADISQVPENAMRSACYRKVPL
jgi:hypothetical protein